MKQYVGRFPVNKGLSKKLGVTGWVIYRDPEIGLYAYNDSLGEEVNLESWNETVGSVSESTLDWWREMIADAEREISERVPYNGERLVIDLRPRFTKNSPNACEQM